MFDKPPVTRVMVFFERELAAMMYFLLNMDEDAVFDWQ
jgi:hypothetical protein